MKFNALPEGLEFSIIPKNKLPSDLRFEAQFFKQRYIAEDNSLSRFAMETVGTFAYVTDGPHGYHEVDEQSPIAMLTAKCASDWFANREGADTIAQWVDDANRRSSLRANDIILSTRGSVGNCALVIPENLPANIDQDVARIAINANTDVIPAFLVAYLNCRFGRDHIVRHASGMVQQGLSLAKVRAIPIPLLSAELQGAVGDVVFGALGLRRSAFSGQLHAERVLLCAFGLDEWTPPDPLAYAVKSSEVFASGRLDAQFYRPKYDDVQARLEATGSGIELGHILTLNARGRQPQYAEGGLPIINSRHVRTNRVVLDEDNRFGIEEGSPIIIQDGDVLLNGTGVGTIGRAAPYLHTVRALPDNHVTVLRTDAIDPIYLSVFLNSPLGQLQIERHIKGSSGQIELYPGDIAKFVVWDAPDETQQRVRNAILAAFDDERRAEDLLNRAKRAVEIAIENSEADALSFLDEEEA